MGYPSTISGREFCRRNSGNVSKDQFYEEYYRILHTSYLRSNSEHCIDIIKKEFMDTFGIAPDHESISYIYSTAKYFVYDSVILSLTTDGKIDSQFYLTKLLIELGFDAWFLTKTKEGTELNFDLFKAFIPLEKSEKTKKSIDDFLLYKLPRSKDYRSLYIAMLPYKEQILGCYERLIQANSADELPSDTQMQSDEDAVIQEDITVHEDIIVQEDITVHEDIEIEDVIIQEDIIIEKEKRIPAFENEDKESKPNSAVRTTGVQVNVPYHIIPTDTKQSSIKAEKNQHTDSDSYRQFTKQKQQAEQRKKDILHKTKSVPDSIQKKENSNKKGHCSSKAAAVGKCLLFAGVMLVPLLILTKSKK